MKNYGYIYLLDCCDCTVCEIERDEIDEEADDIEFSLKRRGLSIDTCLYMYSDSKIDYITIVNLKDND